MTSEKQKDSRRFSHGALEEYREYHSPWLSVIAKSQNKEILNLIKLKSIYSVFECGCGIGDMFGELAIPTRFVCGCDISLGSLNVARLTNPTVHLVLADGENLPLGDEHFDLVVIKGALHHFQNVRLSIEQIKRVLRKNGLVIIVEPSGDSHFMRSMRHFLSKEHERFFESKCLLKLLSDVGFEPVNVSRTGYLSFALGFLFRKRLSKLVRPALLWRGLSIVMLSTDKIFLLPFLQKHSLGIIVVSRKL